MPHSKPLQREEEKDPAQILKLHHPNKKEIPNPRKTKNSQPGNTPKDHEVKEIDPTKTRKTAHFHKVSTFKRCNRYLNQKGNHRQNEACNKFVEHLSQCPPCRRILSGDVVKTAIFERIHFCSLCQKRLCGCNFFIKSLDGKTPIVQVIEESYQQEKTETREINCPVCRSQIWEIICGECKTEVESIQVKDPDRLCTFHEGNEMASIKSRIIGRNLEKILLDQGAGYSNPIDNLGKN